MGHSRRRRWPAPAHERIESTIELVRAACTAAMALLAVARAGRKAWEDAGGITGPGAHGARAHQDV